MAISYIAQAVNSASPNSDTVVTLPTGSMATNDLILIAASVADTANNGLAAPTEGGYTRAHAATIYADDVHDVNLDVYYKYWNGTDTTATFNAVGGANASNVAVCMVFRGVALAAAGGPFSTTSITASGVSSSNADPGSIATTTGDAVVIVGATGHTGGATATYTNPANYTTNPAVRAHNDSEDGLVGMGYRLSGYSNPENPGVFTAATIGTAADNAWAALTMALKVASSDITVGLTGVSSALAVGTMALAMTFGLTGTGLAAGVGTVGLSHTQPLTGVSLSAAVGTIVPNWDLSLALIGTSLSAAVGSVTPSFTLPLTGSGSSLAVGSVGMSRASPLTSVVSEAGIGSLGLEFTLPLTGNGLEAFVGTLIAEQGTANLTLALTGLFSEASVGSLVADRALPFTGVGLEAVIGNLTPGLSFALTGVSLDAATGNLVADRTLTITGVQLEAAVGTITSVQGLLLALTGVYSELSVGSVAASGGTLTGGARLYVRVIRGDRPGGEEDWMVSWNG